jgi:DNA topoisomerase-3
LPSCAERELEIRDFVPVAYFEIVARARVEGGEFQMRHAPPERIVRREKAEEVVNAARGFAGPLGVRVEEKRQGPPRLHDLPSLQKFCGSRFGWPAAKTLDVAQQLYDGQGKKIITYPRAEVRYLPESLIADVPRIVAGTAGGPVVQRDPRARHRRSSARARAAASMTRVLQGASHHAVIPNVNTVDELREIWPRLSPDEKKLFDLIARAYLAAVMPDFQYRQTTADARRKAASPFKRDRPPAHRSRLARRVPAVAARRREGRRARSCFRRCATARPHACAIPPSRTKETRPPPRYSEGTLIEAMQNAWRFVDDEVLRDRLKQAKGIGTPATRAEIIGGLKRQGFLVAQGKHIVPTDDRPQTVRRISKRADPALVDPGRDGAARVPPRRCPDRQAGDGRCAIDAVCDVARRIIGKLTHGPACRRSLHCLALPQPAAAASELSADARDEAVSPCQHRSPESTSSSPRGYTHVGHPSAAAFLEQHAPRKAVTAESKRSESSHDAKRGKRGRRITRKQ